MLPSACFGGVPVAGSVEFYIEKNDVIRHVWLESALSGERGLSRLIRFVIVERQKPNDSEATMQRYALMLKRVVEYLTACLPSLTCISVGVTEKTVLDVPVEWPLSS